MGKYKGFKNRLEKFFSSDDGQRLFNFAYSFGASIVILGALFKLLHLPFADIMLCVGMGTEALIFGLSAFDKPAKNYRWENIFPTLGDEANNQGTDLAAMARNIEHLADNSTPGGGSVSVNLNGTPVNGPINMTASLSNGTPVMNPSATTNGAASMQNPITGSQAAQPSFEGGSTVVTPVQPNPQPQMNGTSVSNYGANYQGAMPAYSGVSSVPMNSPELEAATDRYVQQLSEMTSQMERLKEITGSLTDVSNTLLDSYNSITTHSDQLQANSVGYVSQMEALTRNITGLNTIYEIQLKSVSSQLDTIDKVNSGLSSIRSMYDNSTLDSFKIRQETEKMTENLAQLNKIYERMLTAMTVNMQHNNQ